MQLTVGGDKLNFDGPVSTPTSDLTASKLHWNSVISTPGPNYLVVDVKNFYLINIMMKHEYYNIAIGLIPQEVIDVDHELPGAWGRYDAVPMKF